MNITKLFIIAALALLVLPTAFAIVEVAELPTLVDGHVYTGANMFTPPAVGAEVDVTCEGETDTVSTDDEGYFRALFAIGDCSLGEDVTVCSGSSCDTRTLIGQSARINLLGVKLFDVPEFGAIAATLAVAGAGAGYIALRRRK